MVAQGIDTNKNVEGPALQPWIQLHEGPVSSISLLPDSPELLSAGLGGKLFVVSTRCSTRGSRAVRPKP